MEARGFADRLADASRRALETNPVAEIVILELDDLDWHAVRSLLPQLNRSHALTVGIADRPLPAQAQHLLEALTITIAPQAPGTAWVRGGRDLLPLIAGTARNYPVATMTLLDVLRVTPALTVPQGLAVESLAYSNLLASSEFRRWREATVRRPPRANSSPVVVTRDSDRLHIRLSRPERRNAFDRATRDALIDALTVAELDNTISVVELEGEGPAFCSGGDLDEFGTATDVATAHLVRTRQSVGQVIHRLADRIRVVVHGDCIGAGIELPAFASRIMAREGATFRLPELQLGLIPGAGGTVSLPRRIGPWRTAFMALTNEPVSVETAIEWGLVDGHA